MAIPDRTSPLRPSPADGGPCGERSLATPEDECETALSFHIPDGPADSTGLEQEGLQGQGQSPAWDAFNRGQAEGPIARSGQVTAHHLLHLLAVVEQ